MLVKIMSNIKEMKLPEDFNWKTYLELNQDVNKYSKAEAVNHYIKHGINEKRLYKIDDSKIPNDFNWKEYVRLNKDLKNIDTEIEAKAHYVKYGINEERKYKNDPCIEESVFIHNEDYNRYDYIEEKDILYTKLFFKDNNEYLKNKIDINILNSINSFILVIDFNNGGGGTTIFLNTIVSKYKKYNSFLIIRFDGTKYYLNINEEYLIDIELYEGNITRIIDTFKHKITKIFINHFIGYNKEFIEYILNLNIFKIGITHDYYNIFINTQPTFKVLNKTPLNLIIDINKYDKLITQNIRNVELFSKYYKKHIDVVSLPDYSLIEQKIETFNGDYINCCIIGNINKIKGLKKIIKIIEVIKNTHKYVRFFLIGHVENKFKSHFYLIEPYNNIFEFNNILRKFQPNLIIEATIWPETYSYTLTLSILTGLPIFYLKKPDNCVVKNRLTNYEKSFEFSDIGDLLKLITTKSQDYFYTLKPIIYYNKFWNELFINGLNKNILYNKKFKYDIKPYFIFFPQFHEIYENNINFYNKYTDIKNLQSYNQNTLTKLPEPLSSYCDISNYNYMLNNNLLQKQIDLISEYGFCGLAVYYYWFSDNTFTNKNMIMESVINMFFDSSLKIYDKKIFFIWANEDWTNNVALSPNSCKDTIKNVYNEENFTKNSNKLIYYFKHDNYLKIDNKPVILIYHTYLINNINIFYNILKNICIMSGFDGVHLVLNSFEKIHEGYKNFYVNFNYKKYDSRFYDVDLRQIKLDYKKYMNDNYHIQKDKIQTFTFDFDNRPRLFKPYQLDKSTICVNNTEMHKIVFTKKLLETYNKTNNTELDKLCLINALNEWGENMVFEPSNKYGYYNINLLKKILTE